MDVRYHILWPGGNATALVEGDFRREDYAIIARKILSEDSQLEQVGFIEKPTSSSAHVRLQMMGGEFCGNAARSMAYLWQKLHGIQEVVMEVSGFGGVVSSTVQDDVVTLQLPGNFFIKSAQGVDYCTVDLAGIRHVVAFNGDKQSIDKIRIKHADAPAVGLMTVAETNGVLNIDPTVYVKETETAYHETACGSGSIATALAAYLYRNFPSEVVVGQPTGENFLVSIEKNGEGSIDSISLRGIVIYRGEKNIEVTL